MTVRPDRPKPTKSELLAELESIRYSLSEDEIKELMQRENLEIPVLEEPVCLPEHTDETEFTDEEDAEAVTLTSMEAISDDDLIFDDSGARAREDREIVYPQWDEETQKINEQLIEPVNDAVFSENEADEDDADSTEEIVVFSPADEDSPEATITTMAEKSDFPGAPPGQQQSLFEPSSPVQDKHASQATDENPFLPQHIRQRLSQGRSTIMDDLMQVGNTLNRDKSHFHRPSAGPDSNGPAHPTPMLHSSRQTDRIVEELVAEYLPRMEAELRKRLREELSRPAGKIVDPETSL